jgi:hypothetical protein
LRQPAWLNLSPVAWDYPEARPPLIFTTARNEENYVRIRLKIFGRRFRTGESGDGLARLISIYSSGPKPLTYPAK